MNAILDGEVLGPWVPRSETDLKEMEEAREVFYLGEVLDGEIIPEEEDVRC